MRKVSAIIPLLAAATLLLGSCTKAESPTGEDEKIIPLEIPGNLKSSDESGTVTLSWSAVDKADGYVWEIYEQGSTLKASSKTRNLSVTVEKLSLGREYSARVKAVAGTKSSSAFSDKIKFFPGGTEIIFFKGRSADPGFKWAATDSVLVSDGVSKAVYIPSDVDTALTELCPVAGYPLLDAKAGKFTALYPKNSENILERTDTIAYSANIPAIPASASTDAAARDLVFAPSGGLLHISATNTETITPLNMKIGTSKKICAGDTLVVDFTKSQATLGATPLDIWLLMPSGDYNDLKLMFSAKKADSGTVQQSIKIADGDTTHVTAALEMHSKALSLSLSFNCPLLTAKTTVQGEEVTGATVYYEIGETSMEEVPEPTTSSAVLPSEGLEFYNKTYYVKALAVRSGETATQSLSFDAALVPFGTFWDFTDKTAVGTYYYEFANYCESIGGAAKFINGTSFTSQNLTITNTDDGDAPTLSSSYLKWNNVKWPYCTFKTSSSGKGKLLLSITSRDDGGDTNSLTVYVNGESQYTQSTLPLPKSASVVTVPLTVNEGDVIKFRATKFRIYSISWEADTAE